MREAPECFESVESAQEYLRLLHEVVRETAQSIEKDVLADQPVRRKDALRLVLYNLEKLSQHVKASLRILNDLRTLRRRLLQEGHPQTEPEYQAERYAK